MKTLVILFVSLMYSIGLSSDDAAINQNKPKLEVSDVAITVTVESADDLETLNAEDVMELFEQLDTDDDIKFELICEGPLMENGKPSKFSVATSVSADKLPEFESTIQRLKKAGLNFYK